MKMAERVEKIFQALVNAGISEEEITQQVKEKDNEFQGFMTKSAILYLIAKEHGVNVDSKENIEIMNHITEELIDYNDFAIPISKVSENMQNIVIAGKVKGISPVREFVRKDSTSGRVGSFQIGDNTKCIKIVLWDDNVKVIENEYFKEGEIIQVIGGYSKKGRDEKLEVHVGRKGSIILAPRDVMLPEPIEHEITESPKKKDVDKSSKSSSSWTIQDLHEKEGFIRFISGAVQVEIFKELTLKNGDKSFLLKLLLSDKSASIKVNIWGLNAVQLFKLIKDGDSVKVTNTVIKVNPYTNEKELSFTKSSTLEII